MPDDHESALEITGEIYDAALDPGLWPDVLRRIGDFVGGPATALFSTDAVAQTQRFYYIHGANPEYTRLYEEKYVRLNPLASTILMSRVGEVNSVADAMPLNQFHQTRFYREWVKPQNWGDNIFSLIERSGTVITTLATTIDDRRSPASEEAKQRMALVVPHVRRAVAIGNVIEMNSIKADALGDAVDAFGAAVYLVRRNGEIVRSNVHGRALAEAGSLLRMDDRRIVAVEATGRRELCRAIADAGSEDRAFGPRAAAIPLTDRLGERYVAHVLPLTGGARRRAALSTGAAAAIFVKKAELNCIFPMEAVASQFALSKAELRVLVGVLEIGAPAEVAPMLGLSEATVRTHLRRLYAKTGTCRQADLVKLVACYANPFVEPASDPRTAAAA